MFSAWRNLLQVENKMKLPELSEFFTSSENGIILKLIQFVRELKMNFASVARVFNFSRPRHLLEWRLTKLLPTKKETWKKEIQLTKLE